MSGGYHLPLAKGGHKWQRVGIRGEWRVPELNGGHQR